MRFVGADGQRAARGFLDRLSFLFLSGSLIWCLLSWRDRASGASLVPALVFIGGFFFHLFWEAKCQYTIPYFVLLIPYAAAGYGRLTEWISGPSARRAAPEPAAPLSGTRPPVYLLLVLAACVCLLSVVYVHHSDYLTADDANYEKYMSEISTKEF